MNQDTAGEPSLDEILSSIRRIIAEDGPSIGAASFTPRRARSLRPQEMDDVLLLTRRAPMNERTAPNSPQPAKQPETSPVSSPIVTGQMDAKKEARATQQPTVAPALEGARESAPTVVAADPGIRSEATPKGEPPVLAPEAEAMAADAFADLTAARENARPPSLLMPAPGRTLEDVVREIMRPLLKEWLDVHLAEIVRTRVDEEIERIGRHRVR